jgi:hypothetical protein
MGIFCRGVIFVAAITISLVFCGTFSASGLFVRYLIECGLFRGQMGGQCPPVTRDEVMAATRN